MRNLLFLLVAVLILFSCRKQEESLTITISDWEQSSSTRYGFYDSQELFHHCVGVALVDDTLSCLDTIYDYDPVGGFYNVEYLGDTFPVTANTTYQDFQIFVQVYNGTWCTVEYYDILYLIEFFDGSITEFQFDGAGIQSGYSANDQAYIHSDGKKVKNIFWSDYTYDH